MFALRNSVQRTVPLLASRRLASTASEAGRGFRGPSAQGWLAVMGFGVGAATATIWLTNTKPPALTDPLILDSRNPLKQDDSKPLGDDAAGKPQSMMSKGMEWGSSMLQSFKPLHNIHEHLCGFHQYAHAWHRQLEVHHYCAHVNEDLRQCLVYDSDKPDAKLIGVEYIISEKLFDKLPEEEKLYWHSHVYEVKSGQLVAPGLPEVVEHQAVKSLVRTYGKTWHFWQVDRGDPLPIGPPTLMESFTGDGQIIQELVDRRDKRYGISTEKKKKQRDDIPSYTPSPKADLENKGQTLTLAPKIGNR